MTRKNIEFHTAKSKHVSIKINHLQIFKSN
jgi:hypothetical protein